MYVWNDTNAETESYFDDKSTDDEDENEIMANLEKPSRYICYISHKIDWSNTRIVKAATSINNFLALTDDGKVCYTNVSKEGIHYSMRQVDINEKITCMSCGTNFYVVVTDNCRTFSWGIYTILCGELSLSTSSQILDEFPFIVEEPREMAEFAGKTIVKVVCGINHTLALTDKGKVYGWGLNSYKQLDLNNGDDILSPIMINVANVKKVSDIAVIGSQNFVKSNEDGLVYTWGCIFEITFKKPAIFEYTNVFDISNSVIGQSPISVTREFINEEFDILNDLETAFNDPSTSDLTIIVEKQSIYVHKAILKIRSIYFRSMLQTNFVENSQSIIETHYYR
ncbi:PREDICTED: protein pim1-like [Trachymyrmex cornetzi]|uniref:protein pim1-like n=1 Tax=Trachymyrmex cornetzi TaxID=471704 RepID=UPI00084F0F69|nr:PREDICTED: protein pim1-like [Trachymyrmex cornetzi]